MNEKKIVENNIKKYRELRGLSQIELSLIIGKTEKFIENLENGKYTKALNFKVLYMITKALGIEMKDLFTNDKESENNE